MTDSTQLRLLFESLRQELHTILEAQRVCDNEDKLKALNKEEKAISGLIKALLAYINLQSLKDKSLCSNKQNNLDGVSRDHMLSVKDWFINGIDPAVISHPANCDLVLHRANQRKRSDSSITVEELLDRIKKW